MMKKNYLCILTLIMITGSLSAQFVSNPSFEGPAGQELTPPGWIPGEINSTPDTEPIGEVGIRASDGKTYVLLVSRGGTSLYPNSFESLSTELSAPLEAGTCYDLSIDLTSRTDLSLCTMSGYIEYTETTGLNIFGSTTAGSKGNLLASSGEVRNKDAWQTFFFRIKPDTDISNLTLEVELASGQYGFGNIALDHFRIEQVPNDTTLRMNAIYTPDDLPIELAASTGASYSWVPENGLSCTDCRVPELTEDISGTFTCTILDMWGCPSTELFIIDIGEEPAGNLFIPNVFTPNNDGINDLFEIKGLPPYSSLLIFDSNGKQVFMSETYGNDWDGRNMNQVELPEGTYWYILITPGFVENKKGHVYLKRD